MKLRAKLTLTYGILIFAMLATSSVAHHHMSKVDRITEKFIASRVPVVNRNRDARICLGKSARAIEDLLFYGDDPAAILRFSKEYENQWINSERYLKQLRELGGEYDFGDDNARIRTIDAQATGLHRLQDRIEALLLSRDSADHVAAYGLVRGDMDVQEKALYQTMYDMVVSENAAMETESGEAHRAARTMLVTLWVTTLVGAVLGAGIALVIARRITLNLRSIADRANSIALGDLNGAPLATGLADEIGTLARAMQTMQTNLRHTIGSVAHTAASVTGNAVSIGASGEQMHRRMDEQNQMTEMTVAAVEEMSLSANEVSRHSGAVAGNSRDAAETARKGGQTVREMLCSMTSIAAAFHSISTTISLLGEDSARIGRVVGVIDEIARKTNLLALNAAIEAARAGDQGKGFAVVAGEVRRLAESTAQATGEISQMIGTIQGRAHTAIVAMAQGADTVAAGLANTEHAGQALEIIIGMTEQVDNMIAQIAVAATQQADTAKHSSDALLSIFQLGTANLSTMSSAVAGTDALCKSALDLKQQIEHFQLA